MDKPWDRPWSMDQIIQNSDNWNLAGDVALLNTLKAFADNLMSKTSQINSNLQNLTSTLDETGLQLNIARNEFQSLRNTQFIESRVYEDDESLPTVAPEGKNSQHVEEAGEHTEDIRLAALKGLEMLEEFFEKVEVSVSDSDDEDIDLPNFVLRAKDLYIERPLPYVIGTEEWHKNWHVGLEDSSSDSETEKIDSFSDSSDSEVPIIQDRSRIKGTSDTSSELDFGQQKIEKSANFFHSSDSENSVQATISNRNFAEQLAEKLGHVITQDEEEPEVNRRPIQPPKTSYGDIFFDEPPPLDEPKGPFSGGPNLFDDDDDEDIVKNTKISPKSGGLFDAEDSDDEIFALPKPTKPPPLFDEPPVLEEPQKKPVGGVSMLGGGKIFDKKLLRRQASSSDEEEKKSKEEEKKIDLFGDDDLFSGGSPQKEGVISGGKKTTKKINLFDSDDEDNDGGFLFGSQKEKTLVGEIKEKISVGETKEEGVPKDAEEKVKVSLFDDDDDLFKDDLFSTTTKKKFTSGLFDDDDLFSENKTTSSSLFDDLIDTNNSINNDVSKAEPPEPKPRLATNQNEASPSEPRLATNQNEAPPSEPRLATNENEAPPSEPRLATIQNEAPLSESRLSLFDSPPPEPDDLFAATPIFAPTMRLFDASPPPDDDWSNKSESDREDPVPEVEESDGRKEGGLFMDEPPSLDLKPETVVKKPGKLKHNLNINVGALMPGYAPPKRQDGVEKVTGGDITVVEKRDVKVGFDETDSVEVLHSVTKDRARVPLKRRPSTRRGRKAALKQSDGEFKLEKEESEEKKEEIFVETEQPKSSLFEAEDLFDSEPNEPQKKGSSIFEEEDIFKKSEVKSGGGLFDDEDDGDLFSKKTVLPTKAKKSLFDDDDDDDIFKDFASASTKRTETKVATEKKIPKVGSSVKKLENTKSEDDPLSALLK